MPTDRDPGSGIRDPRRFQALPRLLLGLGAFFALLAGLAACERETPARAEVVTERVVEYRDRPSASVEGELGVPDGMEPFGILVYAEGTSYMALTNSEGQFVLSGLPEGEFTLRASRDDLQSLLLESVTVTEADLRKDQPFVQLQRREMDPKESAMMARAEAVGTDAPPPRRFGTIRGMVRTDVRGDEAGVSVVVQSEPWRTATQADGTFELYTLDPGSYTLQFTRAGYEPVRRDVTVAADQVVEMGTILMRGGTPREQPGRTVFGTVDLLTSDGSPAQDHGNVRVVLEGTTYAATPGSNGRFEIRDVEPGRYTVSASAPGYILERKVDLDLVNSPAGEANLVMLEDTIEEMISGTVTGRVVLQDPPPSGQAGVAVSLIGTNYVAFTDRAGNYQMAKVEPGTYDIMATFAGYETDLIEGILVAEGQTTIVDDLQLRKEVERPRVVFTNPPNGARDVEINQPLTVTIQFSQEMRPSSVRSAITIRPDVDYVVRAASGPGRGTDTFYLELNAVPRGESQALRYGTEYQITISTEAQSMEQVAMEEPFDFAFETGFPRIIGTVPPDGATDAVFLYDEPLDVFFNAPIDRESVDADDIRFSPNLPGSPNIYFRREEETGWTVMIVQGRAEYGEEYEVTIGGQIQTITGQRVRELPYRFRFATRELRSYDDVYGSGRDDLEFDPEEVERRRQ